MINHTMNQKQDKNNPGGNQHRYSQGVKLAKAMAAAFGPCLFTLFSGTSFSGTL